MPDCNDARIANANPVTGRAAWFDVRVCAKADPQPRVAGYRVEVAAENAA